MSRLQERLDFVLGYGVEGNDDLESLEANLTLLEERGTNVNEITERSRAIMAAKAEAEREAAGATEQLVTKQFDLATAVSEANEMVRDVSVGAELLKLEFEQGAISQEEYTEGLRVLQERLEGVEVHTLSSARTMRSLSGEQRKFGQETRGSTRDLNRNQMAMASMGTLLTRMPTNFQSAATQIPMFVRHLNTLEHSTKASGGALKSIVGFMTGPAGIAVAVAALIPALIAANERFGWFNDTLFDTERAGEGAAKQLKAIREEFSKAAGLEGAEALEQQLQTINRQIEEVQADPGRRAWWERGLLRLAAWSPQLKGTQAIAKTFYTDATSREEFLNQLMEQRKELQADIFGARLAEANQVSNLVKLETRMLELTREADEAYKELVENFQLDDDEIIEQGDAMTAKLLEQEKTTAEHWRNIGRQRLQFEQQIANLIFQNNLQEADRRRRLTLQEQQEIKAIRDNEILTERQRQIAIAEIHRNYAHQRTELTKQEEEEKRLEREITHDLAIELLASLQGFGEVIFGQSQENARQAFQLNKALALATATVQGAQAIVRAYAEGGPLEAGLVAGAVAAQIAKIAATRFSESGVGAGGASGGERFTHDFRGANPNTVAGVNNQMKIPDTIKLRDSGGRFLAELEYARDKDDEQAYLTDGRRN